MSRNVLPLAYDAPSKKSKIWPQNERRIKKSRIFGGWGFVKSYGTHDLGRDDGVERLCGGVGGISIALPH